MKTYSFLPTALTSLGLGLVLCICASVATCAQTPAGGDTNAVAKAPEMVKSTFVMPRDRGEGRDPFYPNSNYVYDQSKPSDGGKESVKPVVDLRLTAIGGTAERPVVSINNRTFGEGEEGEMTVNGAKFQIHILDIQEDGVIFTVNGEQRELRFRRY